jgi:hypothetical protein
MYPASEQGLHYPSMYQDLNNGRPTEIDFLNGQIAKYGQEFDVPNTYQSNADTSNPSIRKESTLNHYTHRQHIVRPPAKIDLSLRVASFYK